jgi:hypothetical protein
MKLNVRKQQVTEAVEEVLLNELLPNQVVLVADGSQNYHAVL